MSVIREELLAVRAKHADDRRTEISLVEGEIDIEDLIPVDDMVVTMTHFGYVKRLSQSTYRSQNRGGKGVAALTTREEDFVEKLYVVNSHSDMLFFTNKGKVYSVRVFELPEESRQGRGIPLVNIVNLEPDESVTALLPVEDFSDAKFFALATRLGRIKRVPMSDFESVRPSGLIAIRLNEGDELGWVRMTGGQDDLLLVTRKGKALRRDRNRSRNRVPLLFR